MFKKILFLLLLVPIAHSEILELTCEVGIPIHVVYDFETNEGYLNIPNDGFFIPKRHVGKKKIHDFRIIGDWYIFNTKTSVGINVNRITLNAYLKTLFEPKYHDGKCEKGLKTYDKYQI
tara:strand:+ start:1456 stop:1812 length:357 start_codon:yes stop_codon:yes gene_type:complete